MRNIKRVIAMGLILSSQYVFSQKTIADVNLKDNTMLISEIQFLKYQVETLYQIVSIQSSSINSVNLMIQIINEENKRLRNEINAFHKTLEAVDKKKIRRRTFRKQKSELLKL